MPSTNPKATTTLQPNGLSNLDTLVIPEFSVPYSLPDEEPHPEEEERKTLYIGQENEFWNPPTHAVMWLPPAALPTLVAEPVVWVSDILDSGEISIFRHPKLVEEMHFVGFLSQFNFNVLTAPLINLEILDLHISVLENFNFPRKIAFPNFLNLPKLESLQISSTNFGKSHVPKFKMEKIVTNACSLLTKTFPSLNFLSVSLPLLRHRDREISQALLKCARTHYRTLKSLNIELTFDASAQDNSKSTFTTDQEMDFTDSNGIQLHSFHYYSTYKTETTVLWRNFLHTQVKLEYLQLWCGEKYFSLPTPVILLNAANLHTIALNINPLLGAEAGVTRSHIDCKVFSKCHLLKTLVLKGKPIGEINPSLMTPQSITEMRKSPNITHCHYLPGGLENLRLIHLKMLRSDASVIARNLPALTKLYLEDIGIENQFGMALEDLAFLMEKPKKKLINLDIHQGLNKASFKDAPTNDGWSIIAKLFFKLHNPNTFQARLQENGEYDTVEVEAAFEDANDILVEKEVFHDIFEGMVTDEDLKPVKILKDAKNLRNAAGIIRPGVSSMPNGVTNNLNRSAPQKQKTVIKNAKPAFVTSPRITTTPKPWTAPKPGTAGRIMTSKYQGVGKFNKNTKS